ncbi:aldo/keto reductase [Flavobacterium sp. CLA17]|uniref:aldo/keto reductase n=1 Tax=Flavobacterium sp. CLA17 TaxID=2724135 RepID=UPI001490F051|nr:aldo/keto reductase [Flavobacterium sp. CLA17]QSB27952.1 aldo/keto reductase [Flavobacterium sp. CLA17]
MNLNNKIGLGTVQFGMPYGVSNKIGQTNPKEVQEILSFSECNGITYLDTAPAYGNAETILGNIGVDQFKIVSKFMPCNEDESLNIQLEKSLANLKINSLYGYIAHRPTQLYENPKQWDDLLRLKEEKKIKKIGFSLNQPRELDFLLQKGMIPDLIQVPYNYFDNRFREYIVELKKEGCEIHARSPFLQGLFFTNHNELPPFFNELKENIIELKDNFGEILSAVLLKYILSLDFIDIVIMGVENVGQLANNLRDIHNAEILTPREFNFSDSVLIPSNWPKKI